MTDKKTEHFYFYEENVLNRKAAVLITNVIYDVFPN